MGEITCDNCINYKAEGCFKCEGYIPRTLKPREAFNLFMDELKAPKEAEFRVFMDKYLEKAEKDDEKLGKINDILNTYYRGDIDDPRDVVDLICDVA